MTIFLILWKYFNFDFAQLQSLNWGDLRHFRLLLAGPWTHLQDLSPGPVTNGCVLCRDVSCVLIPESSRSPQMSLPPLPCPLCWLAAAKVSTASCRGCLSCPNHPFPNGLCWMPPPFLVASTFARWPALPLSQLGLSGCHSGGCGASRNRSWVLKSLAVGRASLLKRVLVRWARWRAVLWKGSLLPPRLPRFDSCHLSSPEPWAPEAGKWAAATLRARYPQEQPPHDRPWPALRTWCL